MVNEDSPKKLSKFDDLENLIDYIMNGTIKKDKSS